jgi:hypothetical protein
MGTSWCGHNASRSLSKWSLDGTGLVGLPLGRRLALYRRNEIVVTVALVVLLLLLKARGRPFVVVHDLLPLALKGVEHRGDRFLAVGVVARDVEELAGHARHASPESMDEGRARRAVFERRDDVVVGRTVELGAVLGEVPYVLTEALPRLLLVVVQLPLLARAHVGALEVADEDPA